MRSPSPPAGLVVIGVGGGAERLRSGRLGKWRPDRPFPISPKGGPLPNISITADGDDAGFAQRHGLNAGPVLHTTANWAIHALDHGMASGATSLMVVIPVDVDGIQVKVMAETSLAAFMMAATALAATHTDEVTKPGWALLTPMARALLLPRMAEALQRSIPQATPEQVATAAEMVLDGFGADAP